MAVLVTTAVGGCVFGGSSEEVTAGQVEASLKQNPWPGVIGGAEDDGTMPEAGFMGEFQFLEGGNVNFFVGPIEVVARWEVVGDGEETPFSVRVWDFTVRDCHVDRPLYCAIVKPWAEQYFSDAGEIVLDGRPGDELPRWLKGTAPPSGDDGEPVEIAVTRNPDAELAPADLVGDWSGTFESGARHERRLEIFENSSGTNANAYLDGNEQYTGKVVVMAVGDELYWGTRDTSTAEEAPITGGRIETDGTSPQVLSYPERDGVVSTLELSD